MRYDTYSLKKILTDLTNRFQGINEIYLFGSRLHRTMSTRSDVDLLISVDKSVIAEDVRDFALAECKALDFFLIDRGVATSCANGSKVKARSKKSLISNLGAEKIWDKSIDFLPADIDWDFNVIKGMNPIMTSLVTSEPFPSKAEAISSNAPIETQVKGDSSWPFLKDHPLWVIAGVIVATAAITFKVMHEVRIVPLKEEVVRLEKQLKSAVSKPEKSENIGDEKPNKSFKASALRTPP